MKEEDRNLYQKALSKWGVSSQLLMLFEEMGELMQAISKFDRFFDTQWRDVHRENLIDEIADVKIMLEQLQVMSKISDQEVNLIRETKLNRLKDILERRERSEEAKP